MPKALKLAAIGVPALLCLATAVLAEFVPNPDFSQGDPEKGKVVYQRVGVCVVPWLGRRRPIGERNPLSHAAAANLRETSLDQQGLYDVIRCGIPGTAMPYHDSVSYKDGRCHGLTMADFGPGEQPMIGKTMREKQMLDLIAYLEKYMIGHGKPTYDECALYFGPSAEKACAYLKGR